MKTDNERVITLLKRKQGSQTQASFARSIGVSPSYLNDVYKGNRQPGSAVLSALGLIKKVVYERDGKNGTA